MTNTAWGRVEIGPGASAQIDGTFENFGSLDVTGGSMALNQANFANDGSATVGASGSVETKLYINYDTTTVGQGGQITSVTYLQYGSAATTRVDGVLKGTEVSINSGALSGTGTVQGSLYLGELGGVLAPAGVGVGALSGSGFFWEYVGATLEMEIVGPSSYDRLFVGGTAYLDGLLRVQLDGYTPGQGDVFRFLTFGSRGWPDGTKAAFSTYDLPALTGGLQWWTRKREDKRGSTHFDPQRTCLPGHVQ